jgi:hypothetical protein
MIYVASSWRNTYYDDVVVALRAAAFDVYDFRRPDPSVPARQGFSWAEIDPQWQSWSPERYREALEHPIAQHGLGRDIAALFPCEACVLVLPCGRSAHLEAGHALGAGRPVIAYIPEPIEPELMYGMLHEIALSLDELVAKLGGVLAHRRSMEAR